MNNDLRIMIRNTSKMKSCKKRRTISDGNLSEIPQNKKKKRKLDHHKYINQENKKYVNMC